MKKAIKLQDKKESLVRHIRIPKATWVKLTKRALTNRRKIAQEVNIILEDAVS